MPDAIRSIDLGDCTVRLLDGGALKLDGGAMFGIIPKPLWTRATPADNLNRIALASNCLLVEWRGESARRLLIEVGRGDKYAEKEQRFFEIDPSRWLLHSLRDAGVEPESITDIALTHLHFDHMGALTRHQDDRLIPTFPNARVHVQKQEQRHARDNYGIMTNTYRPENLEPISAADLWRPLDGEAEIVAGVRPLLTPGHTRGHQSVVIDGADRTLIYVGDVIPTTAHIGAAWNMAYDLFPLENRESKQRVLREAATGDALLVIGHDPQTPVVRAVEDKGWYRLEPAS